MSAVGAQAVILAMLVSSPGMGRGWGCVRAGDRSNLILRFLRAGGCCAEVDCVIKDYGKFTTLALA